MEVFILEAGCTDVVILDLGSFEVVRLGTECMEVGLMEENEEYSDVGRTGEYIDEVILDVGCMDEYIDVTILEVGCIVK